nr:reverse transcriptase domain-containing protein [Tanacetum cinerariifolium]
DETISASVHEVGESSTTPLLREDSDGLFPAHALVKKKGKAKDEFYGKLILDLDKVECKKLKKELEEARFSNTFLPAIRRMIKDNVDDVIAAERARQANVRNDASGSGSARGQDATHAALNVQRAKRLGLLLQHYKYVLCLGGMLREYNIMAYTQRFNELALMCPRMVKPDRVKVDAYTQGLTDNIKGEVTSSRPVDLSEAVRMAHKLMDQKAQARDERILEGKKRKWGSFQSGNSKDFLCVNDVLLAILVSVRSSATCVERLGKSQGHTRNQFPKTVKQEEVGEVRGRAYAIKDVEPKGPNMVTGTFLLINRYAFVLFNSGSDRSFVDTRFSSMLDIDPVKIEASYEVELDDGRVVSTNTVLKGCTLNLVNRVFKIDLMPIELGTYDIIIDMDWIDKHDAFIVCGERVVRIPYGNKMLIVERDKGVSRLKVISCIKA